MPAKYTAQCVVRYYNFQLTTAFGIANIKCILKFTIAREHVKNLASEREAPPA